MVAPKWLYLLLLIPSLSELLENGRLPSSPREMTTDLILTIVVGILICYVHRKYFEVICLSETDELTGLSNRRRFQDDLFREVTRARRMGSLLTVVYIDIDRFKSINDRYGHAEGDRILKYIGNLFKVSIRRGVDKCYRVGGDEFVVLLPSKDSKGVKGALERILLLKTRAVEFLDRYGSNLSIGTAELIDDESPEAFLKRADRIMYTEKNKKREERPKINGIDICEEIKSSWDFKK